jgi:uncharacterized protein YciI
VSDYYVVRLVCGPAWDRSRGRREQQGWEEHAAFMDALVDEGAIVLGGPVGDLDGEYTLHIFDMDSEAAIRERMAADPWAGDMLRIVSVEPWWVWLRAPSSD